MVVWGGVGIVNAQIPLAEASTYIEPRARRQKSTFFSFFGGGPGVFLLLAFYIYFITSQPRFSVLLLAPWTQGASIFFR